VLLCSSSSNMSKGASQHFDEAKEFLIEVEQYVLPSHGLNPSSRAPLQSLVHTLRTLQPHAAIDPSKGSDTFDRRCWTPFWIEGRRKA
jgi:hypothetical protein